MMRLVRRVFGIRQVIGRERALEIAKEECARRGWPWVEPINLEEGLFAYAIRTNAASRGGNVNIYVRCVDGRVSRAALAPY